MDEMKILVTFVNPYSLDNGASGLVVNYFFWGDNGELMESRNDLSGGMVGSNRAKMNMRLEDRSKFSFVPGVYKAKMGLKIGSDGKPVAQIVDITEFVGKVCMSMEPSGK